MNVFIYGGKKYEIRWVSFILWLKLKCSQEIINKETYFFKNYTYCNQQFVLICIYLTVRIFPPSLKFRGQIRPPNLRANVIWKLMQILNLNHNYRTILWFSTNGKSPTPFPLLSAFFSPKHPSHFLIFFNFQQTCIKRNVVVNKGNNKITELRTILQRESQNSEVYKQTKSVNNQKTVKTVMTLTWYRHF
jgi:hypothetical protein